METGIKNFYNSFCNACRGLKFAILYEKSFQIEVVIAALVLILILVFKIKNWEAIIVVLMIMWILVTELINTVVERVVDILKPRVHPYARLIKDIMAAVVLISCIFATAIGIIIFLPYFRELFSTGF